MPVQIACPKCSKRYSLPDTALGKAVKCKSCGTTFRTKKPGQAQPPAASPANAQPTRSAQPAASEDLSQFGIDGGFQKEADIFSSPPPPPQALAGFGNYAEEDPGFDEDAVVAQVKSEQKEGESLNPYQSILNNPALRQVKKSGKKDSSNAVKIRKQHIEQETEIKEWGLVMMVLGVLSALLSLVIGVYSVFFATAVVPEEGVALTVTFLVILFAVIMFFNMIQIAIGWGMHRLNGLGRIGGTIFWAIHLLAIPVGTIVGIIVLRILWNERAATIFSPEYKDIREATPEIKHKSITAVLAIGFVVVMMAGYSIYFFFFAQ